MNFPTGIASILKRIDEIDPISYAKTRNFKGGAVSYLSPYISRGVLSTKQVLERLMQNHHQWEEIEKFVQELAWRDYWQQVWIEKGDEIHQDLKRSQEKVAHHQIPENICKATTGIHAIDEGIQTLYESNNMHNHMRMYVASVVCNIGQAHWLQSAKWMYAHLIDGDWASNALSWQWVAGSNANKKYFANQDNINHFFNSDQKNTFLDYSYEELPEREIPVQLKETTDFVLKTNLPETPQPKFIPDQKTLIYNYYNLDPFWHADEDMNRILLLEPSFFQKYPITDSVLNFALDLAKNIPGIQVFTGEFEELTQWINPADVIYKEHPENKNYLGAEEARDWMFSVKGYYPSFFKFWKQCKKEIINW